jgi:hypothetical protein
MLIIVKLKLFLEEKDLQIIKILLNFDDFMEIIFYFLIVQIN